MPAEPPPALGPQPSSFSSSSGCPLREGGGLSPDGRRWLAPGWGSPGARGSGVWRGEPRTLQAPCPTPCRGAPTPAAPALGVFAARCAPLACPPSPHAPQVRVGGPPPAASKGCRPPGTLWGRSRIPSTFLGSADVPAKLPQKQIQTQQGLARLQ